MPASLTLTLANFVNNLRFQHLPKRAVSAIETGFVDAIGVLHAGMDLPLCGKLLATCETRGLVADSRLFLGHERASAGEAAFVNCATLTSVVYDDVAFGGCHTSAILVPAILAEADKVGSSGKDLLTAYAAGYEVWARIAERDPDGYASKGWHATANFGAIAAAAAISNLLRYDEATTLTALGIAAALTGGTTASFDTDAAPIQVARAAASGILAARMAREGASAPADALERAGRGALFALSPKGNVDLETEIDDLGNQWRLETVGIHCKQYPFGNMLQRALDGMLDLVRDHNVNAENIARVEALLSEPQFAVVSASPSVKNFVPSFSIGLAMAAAALTRRASFEELKPSFYERAEVTDFMKRVEMVCDPAIPADTTPNLGYSGALRVHLKDGQILKTDAVSFARGHWTRPMAIEEKWEKFRACTSMRLEEAVSHRLFVQLNNLIKVENVNELATAP